MSCLETNESEAYGMTGRNMEDYMYQSAVSKIDRSDAEYKKTTFTMYTVLLFPYFTIMR